LALFIGDESEFSAVGLHSWEAWCADCGFSKKETLRGLKAFQAKFLPAWHRLLAQITRSAAVTDAERDLLGSMTSIFEQHSADFAQMTAA
jgi:serine/threonine-protein kinase HipA